MASQLQRLISVPVTGLVRTARRVSQTNDYSVRADKISNDELGVLTEEFNWMLTQIEERDGACMEEEKLAVSQWRNITCMK